MVSFVVECDYLTELSWNITYPFEIISRGWMEELFTHVIIETFSHLGKRV